MAESPPRLVSRATHIAIVLSIAAVAGLVVLAAALIGDRRSGDRFDLVRWERDMLPGKWLYLLGAGLRDDPPHDEAIRRYFAAPVESEERRRLESTVEAALSGRIDAVLRERGLHGAVPLPGSVFPPVNMELTEAPRVLVLSPRAVIQRASTELLRPDLTTDNAVAIERRVEGEEPDRSALVVGSGGVATYPAIIGNRTSYANMAATAAHEWVHHYLAFAPLGMSYFSSRDSTAINETVADIVGDEVGAEVVDRWGDPTRPSPTLTATPTVTPTPRPRSGSDPNAVLRDLRREVDALLAAGRIDEAEARMEQVRLELWDTGYRIRRLNQAYFAWYGTYTARPDGIDPLGGQLREIRQRSASLAAFVETVRVVTSRQDVAAILERVRGGG